MPSFNVAIPTLPRAFDHQDVVDNVDRKLLVAEQSVALSLQQLNGLIVDPSTGVEYAGDIPAPGYITTTDQTAYETAIKAAATALNTAAVQLAVIAAYRA